MPGDHVVLRRQQPAPAPRHYRTPSKPSERNPAVREQLSFLRREGREIVSADGEPVRLRGVGLGNWLLPEGYMWLLDPRTASPRQIEALVRDLIGADAAEDFWCRYRGTYITDDDISAIARCGFNSVRVPINWRILMRGEDFDPDGFAFVDGVINSCRRHGVYAVLDLHAAPGGQTGTNIDDSLGWPDLFTDRRNQQLTIDLWVELARRYHDDPVVAGYDLLNEPLPGEHRDRYREQLVSLYRQLIAAIRQVDQEHLIILEGMHWSNDWSIFTQRWDDQLVLQFHKYWDSPDTASIAKYLKVRDQLDVPIWLGESGENHLAWYQGTFGMCDDLGIGWNFWQWKKLGTKVSPLSITVPEKWRLIQAAAAGGPMPSSAEAMGVLEEFLGNLPFDVCEQRTDVIHAITRRVPLRLNAEHFGHLGPDVSWSATKRDAGLRGFRDRDSVTIGFTAPDRTGEAHFPSTGEPEPPASEAMEICLHSGEWVKYRVETRCHHKLMIRVVGLCTPASGLRIGVDGVDAIEHEPSSDDRIFTFVTAQTVPPGDHEITLAIVAGEARVRWLDIKASDA